MDTMDYEDFRQSFDLSDIDEEFIDDYLKEDEGTEGYEELREGIKEDEDFLEAAYDYYYELYLIDQRPCFG